VLIHRRKVGEALLIGNSIEIRVISVGKEVVLGIIAPRHVSISACKVGEAAMENTIAASHAAGFDRKMRGASRKSTTVVLAFESDSPE
jgi:carbon storage regulator CsrA